GLVERPPVGGAAAEEAEADLVRPAQPDAVADPRRQRQVAAYDPVPAEIPLGDVVEVHGAALAAADAGDLPAQLGQQQPRVGAAGQRIAVVTVVRDEVIVGAHLADRAHPDRFLPDAEVEDAADLAL